MSKLGTCRSCGDYPVARNAPICGNCGKLNPNPGFFSKWIPRLLLIGFFIVTALAVIAYMGGS